MNRSSSVFLKRLTTGLLLATAIALLAWCGPSLLSVLTGDRSATEQVAELRRVFLNFGALAPLVYLVFVTVEVVIAPIPGLMLYAPGGILFGPWLGGFLALLGNVLGAGIACSVTRRIGNTWLSRFFDPQRLQQTQQVIQKHGLWIVVLLRLNPVTSSDLVSYAAGFTQISIMRVMLGTAIGMAPLCFLQAWLAESLITAAPWLLYPLIVACILYAAAVCVVLRRLISRPASTVEPINPR